MDVIDLLVFAAGFAATAAVAIVAGVGLVVWLAGGRRIESRR